MEILFFSEQTQFSLENEENTGEWIEQTIAAEGKKASDLNIIFTSDEYLLDINKQYLNHDFYTDVVAFDYSDQNFVSGDVFISIDRVGENAKKYSQSFEQELYRVIIHGILHLCGYNDKTDEQKQAMRTKEDAYLWHILNT